MPTGTRVQAVIPDASKAIRLAGMHLVPPWRARRSVELHSERLLLTGSSCKCVRLLRGKLPPKTVAMEWPVGQIATRGGNAPCCLVCSSGGVE